MRRDVVKFVQECTTGEPSKYFVTTPFGLLQPISLPAQLRDKATMDFIEGLPCSGGWNTILVVVDWLSKYVHFLGLKHSSTAVSVAGQFAKEIIRLHGLPYSIIFDWD